MDLESKLLASEQVRQNITRRSSALTPVSMETTVYSRFGRSTLLAYSLLSLNNLLLSI